MMATTLPAGKEHLPDEGPPMELDMSLYYLADC
jgi:hypothetical protein